MTPDEMDIKRQPIQKPPTSKEVEVDDDPASDLYSALVLLKNCLEAMENMLRTDREWSNAIYEPSERADLMHLTAEVLTFIDGYNIPDDDETE